MRDARLNRQTVICIAVLLAAIASGCAPAATGLPTEATTAASPTPGEVPVEAVATPSEGIPLAGCPNEGGTIVMGYNWKANNLNLLVSAQTGDRRYAEPIFDGLAVLNGDAEVVPQLAESWEVSEDGLRWTFYLRSGVKWHDGEPFTAEDVEWCFETILNPEVSSPQRSKFLMIEEVKAVDATTVEFSLSEPSASFLVDVATWPYISPKHILENEADLSTASFNRSPIGTGPFKLVSWDSSDVITLEANDEYFNGRPCLDRVIEKPVTEATVANAQLQTGELDTAWLRQPDVPVLEKLDTLKILRAESPIVNLMAVNHRNPLFQDKTVRQALAYALDREGMVQSAWGGQAGVLNAWIPPGITWAYNAEVQELYPYDPVKAAELLESAGWTAGPDGILMKDGERFEFTLYAFPEWQPFALMAEVVQQNLSDIGIKVDVELRESMTWNANIWQPGDFDATIGYFHVADPDALYPRLHCSQFPPEGMNNQFYCNEEVGRLIEAGRTELDQAKRRDIYDELQWLIAEEMPYIFINSQRENIGNSLRLQGYVPTVWDHTWNIESWWVSE